jgi:hypothetical protein
LLAADQVVHAILLEAGELELAGALLGVQIDWFPAIRRV